MIRIIIGSLGAGKTCWSTADAERELRKGIPQVVNWPTNVEGILTLTKWEDMMAHKEAHIRVDEAYNWFPRTQYQMTTMDDLAYYKQSRHVGISIDLLCHNTNDLSNGLYRIASEVIVIKRPFGPTPQDEMPAWERAYGAWVIVWTYYADGFETPTKRAIKRIRFFRLDTRFGKYARYNTVGKRDGRGSGIVSRSGTGQARDQVVEREMPACLEGYVRQVQQGVPGRVRYVRGMERLIIDARSRD